MTRILTPAPPWWMSAVVYQVYPRSFADSNGDGIGDLPGITARLDHLADLGVDVLWLSPVYPSPQVDNGYDISDYQDVDPVFGTLADLDALLESLHARGMRLILDVVVNHTSDQHPWFVASRSSRDDPRRDWYWWRPARPGRVPGAPGAEPNNWGSAFGGSAWQFDPATQEYYLHSFAPQQPDLNWENPQVRQAVFAMLRWWLDRGVDGFRLDVISMISKNPALPDGPAAGAFGDSSRLAAYGPRLHDYLQQLHREVFGDRPGTFLTVGETPGVSVAQARLLTDPTRHELDMVFEFEHVSLDRGATKWDVRPLRLTDLKACLDKWQTGLAEVGWNSLYWDNHDQPRAVSRFGDDGRHRVASAKTLATVLHLQRGTPYVYQGEELGMTNAHWGRIEDYRDVESLAHYRAAVGAGARPDEVLRALETMSRDNARTPMQWDASAGAGFTTGRPWIAVNRNALEINVAAQREDPDSVLAHYRRLIALRHSEPVVAYGDFTMLLPDDERVYAFTRRLGGVELLVLANFSAEPVTPDVAEAWSSAEVLLGDLPGAGLALAPWQSRVYRRRHAH